MNGTSTDKSNALINRPFHGMSSMSKYHGMSKLGQGTFGEVVKARSLEQNKLVALKSIIVHNQKGGFPITALREVNIMKRLKHKNILQLLELVCKRDADLKGVKKLPVFYMVMPYMSYDLAGLLTNPKVNLTQPHIKCLMKQLLEGINYIHQQHFFHRDIKAANILIDHHGVLKIADFGLARNYEGSSPKRGKGPCGSIRRYTGLVVTRWYRAPELLLGNQRYTTAIDLWGVGCVFAEMFERSPILQGKSDLDQGRIIFELVGPPSVGNWKDYDKLPHAGQFVFPASRRNLEERFSKIGQQGLSLLDGMLKLDPRLRLNALDALDHPYFTTSPLPCLPIELPKFEDCHEIDADKFREEQKRNAKVVPRDAWSSSNVSNSNLNNTHTIPKISAGDSRYPAHIPSRPKSQGVYNTSNRPVDQSYSSNRYRKYDRGAFTKETDPTMGLAAANRGQPSSLPQTPNIGNSYRPVYRESKDNVPLNRSIHQGYSNKRQRYEEDFHDYRSFNNRNGNSMYKSSSYRYRSYENDAERDRYRRREDDDMKIDYSDESLAIKTSSKAPGENVTSVSSLPLPPPPPHPRNS